jgi:3-deoxy-D-manno-octulosonate 8-phosphate phosphatase (KDO 8-P phosphatase)
METSYKEVMTTINTFIFDVDGVLTDGTVMVTSAGELIRTMHTKDGYALKVAVDAGYKVCIISGGTNEGVKMRLQGLGVTDVFLGVSDKIEVFDRFVKANDLSTDSILFMGDDLPDYPLMSRVGLPCCPKDAVMEIQDISLYVSQKKGGKGCVRDVIEQVMKVQGKWNGLYNARYD